MMIDLCGRNKEQRNSSIQSSIRSEMIQLRVGEVEIQLCFQRLSLTLQGPSNSLTLQGKEILYFVLGKCYSTIMVPIE